MLTWAGLFGRYYKADIARHTKLTSSPARSAIRDTIEGSMESEGRRPPELRPRSKSLNGPANVRVNSESA